MTFQYAQTMGKHTKLGVNGNSTEIAAFVICQIISPPAKLIHVHVYRTPSLPPSTLARNAHTCTQASMHTHMHTHSHTSTQALTHSLISPPTQLPQLPLPPSSL